MRSIRMLTENPKISFDDLARLKLSTRLELADRILDDLIAAANQSASSEAKTAAAVLRSWDRQADNDSRGALLFQIFADKFLANAKANFAVTQDYREPLTTPRGLADPAAAVRMLEQAALETRNLYGSLEEPWGEFMRLHRGATDLPANGAPGALGAFRVLQYAPASRATRSAMFGDTFVALVEFTSPPHARVLLSYGNSSQPGSPHAEDQLPLLSKKQMRTAWRERKDVEANLESRDEF
jgi:acyl-homoserine-lactone acylase